MRKKFTVFTVMLCVLTIVSSNIVFADGFKDMKKHWGKKYVEDVVSKGIIKGYEDNTFRPSQPVTKIEGIVMISNLFSQDEIDDIYAKSKNKYQKAMDDSKIPTWAQKYVVFAVEKDMFPSKSIPYLMTTSKKKTVQSLSFRQEFVMLLVNALDMTDEFSKSPNLAYKDANKIDSKAVPFVEVLGRKGIIQTKGNFEPKKQLTRAEAAVILSKAYKFAPKEKYVPSTPKSDTKDEPEYNEKIEGVLKSVFINADTVTLNITDKSGMPKVYSAKNPKITVDGKIALSSDLKRGMQLKLSVSGNSFSTVEATTVSTETQPDKKPDTTDGDIKQSIGVVKNASTYSVTMDISGEERSFNIDAYTKVLIDGKEDSIDNVKSGDKIILVSQGNKTINLIVSSETGTVTGTVKGITSYYVILDADGVDKEFEINRDTKLYRGKNPLSSATDIALGEKVEVTLKNGAASVITVPDNNTNLKRAVVTGINLKANKDTEITVKDKNGDLHSYRADAKTTVYIKNKIRSIEDIRLWYEVDVYVTGGYIDEIDTNGEYKSSNISGTVKKVDDREGLIVIISGDKEYNVIVNKNTLIQSFASNREKDIYNILKGDSLIAEGIMGASGFEANKIVYIEN